MLLILLFKNYIISIVFVSDNLHIELLIKVFNDLKEHQFAIIDTGESEKSSLKY